MLMQSRSHPKLISRGAEVEEADLKFKGAPADDCDPFAIQNYIDRLAAEVYDTIHGTKLHANKNQEEKDEWELMKEKARSVPFQDVSLSIALKHGLLDEVKKENANRQFDRENILTIMKVRDEFLQDYADASSFEYQWQIWVEWERYLKQIGVTIPQWGKIARKLIRLGVQRIQEDMTKKYTQISSGNKRKSEGEGDPSTQDRRRKLTPIDTNTAIHGSGFSQFISSTIHRNAASYGGAHPTHFGVATQFHNSSPSPTQSCSPPFSPMTLGSPMNSPRSFSSGPPPFVPPFGSPQVSTFGASLYNMISPNTPPSNLFSTTTSSTSTSTSTISPSNLFTSPIISTSTSPLRSMNNLPPHAFEHSYTTNYAPLAIGNTSLPSFSYDAGFMTAPSLSSTQPLSNMPHTSTPTYSSHTPQSSVSPSPPPPYSPITSHSPSYAPISPSPLVSSLSSLATLQRYTDDGCAPLFTTNPK